MTKESAKFVDNIHTDGKYYGTFFSKGHIDFFAGKIDGKLYYKIKDTSVKQLGTTIGVYPAPLCTLANVYPAGRGT